MNLFRKLALAVENIAASINSLAMTLDAVSAEIRQRVGIPAESGPSLLTQGNGEAEATEQPSAARKRRS